MNDTSLAHELITQQ